MNKKHNEKVKKEKRRREKVIQAIKEINKLRESTGIWDGVSEIRRFRDSRGKY